MLKIKFIRIKNIILMEILAQGLEIKKGDFEWEAPNGIKIESYFCPEPREDSIYVRGNNHAKDNNMSCHEFDCEEDAINALQKYAAAVRDFNNQLEEKEKEKEKEIETEFDEVVIAE